MKWKEPRLEKSDELQNALDEKGLDLMDYDVRWGRYRIRLTPDDLEQNREVLAELLRRAHQEASK